MKFGDTIFFKDVFHHGVFACKKRKICQAVIQQLTEEAEDTPPDLRDSCFVVYPKYSFSHVQRAKKHEKIHRETPEDDWPDKIQRTIGKYRKLAKDEKQKNKAMFSKVQGSDVALGATIMLYHTKSKCFLTMIKESADIDKNALKLVIEPEGSKNAWFDIIPGFKTSKTGGPVPFGSSVALRSTKNDITVSVSDHVESGMPLPHPYCEKVIEVNCFINPQVFIIDAYKEPNQKEYDLTLSSGDIISLYHTDSGSNLVCRDGRVFFYKEDDSPGEVPPLDSSALWFFEKKGTQWGGADIDLNTMYRIRHANTGLVLGENEAGEFTMSKEYLDVTTNWLFKPFGSNHNKEIYFNSFSQFYNANSRHFLSEKGQVSDGSRELLAGPSTLGSDRDAIEIRRPSAKSLEVLDTVKAAEFRLSNVLGRMRKEHGKSGDLQKAVTPENKLLVNLYTSMILACSRSDNQNPMSRDGPPVVPYQDAFGEQGIIDMTMELLQLIMDEWEIDMDEIQHGFYGEGTFMAMKLMIRFLRASVKEHYANQIICSKYLEWLGSAEQLGLPLNIVDAVAGIYDANATLLEVVTDDAISELVELMEEKHREDLGAPRFVDLLRMLCVCKGSAVPSNQNKICEHFLKNKAMHCHVKHMKAGAEKKDKGKKGKKKDKTIAINDSKVGKVLPHIAAIGIDQDNWIPLTLFCGKTAQILAKPLPECNAEERLYRYHIQSLRLFVAGCLGRNRGFTDYLLTQAEPLGLSFDNLFTVVKFDGLPPFYRGLCAEVILALYIDREPSEDITPINRVRIWQAIDTPVCKRAQKVKVDPFKNFPELRPTPGFPQVKDYQTLFYGSLGGQFSQDVNLNSMISTMLKISQTLLSFGLYHDVHGAPDLATMSILLDPLLDLLDGRQDGKEDGWGDQRFTWSDRTAPRWDARLVILQILEFVFDCRVDKRLGMAYDLYEKSLDQGFSSNRLPTLVGNANKVAKDMAYSAAPWTKEQMKNLAVELFDKPLINKRVAMSTDLLNPPEFVKALLDCTLMDSVELNVFALSLLNRHYGQRSSLVKIMQSVQIVAFEDVAVLRYSLAVTVSELRRNKKWLMSTDQGAREQALGAVSAIFDRCMKLCTVNEIVDIVEGKPTVITAVEVPKFQSMMVKLGLHIKVFDMLAMPFTADNQEGMDLWCKCYELLAKMCFQNCPNQQELYKSMNLFHTHMMLEPISGAVSQCVTNCIADNKAILEGLTDDFFKRGFRALVKYKDPLCLKMFEVTLSLNGEKKVRNCTALMGKLSANGSLFTWWDGVEGRTSLMTAMLNYCAGDKKGLEWHLAGLSLMSTLCEGKAPDYEVKAQSYLSYFHAMERCVMFSEHPPSQDGMPTADVAAWKLCALEVKRAYFRFVTAVYLTSSTEVAARTVSSLGAKVWPHHEEMDPAVKLQRLWLMRSRQKMGIQISAVTACCPRTMMQEAIISLHTMNTMIDQLHTPGDSTKKKKKKKSAEEAEDLLSSVDPVNMSLARELADFCLGCLLPFLSACISDYEDTHPAIRKILVKTASTAMLKIIGSQFCVAKYERFVDPFKRILEDKDLYDGDEEVNDIASQNLIFKNAFGVFIEDFAAAVGVADLKRVLGAGIKNLAILLSKTTIPGTEPPVLYRQVIASMYKTLAGQPKQITAGLTTDLLRVSRAMLYIEDAIEPEDTDRITVNWNNFVVDAPPEKSEPQRQNLQYVQGKYANLEAGAAIAIGLALPDGPSAMAGIRFGLTFLESGNSLAQNKLLSYLIQSQNSDFWYRLDYNIKEGIAFIRQWMKVVRYNQEMATRRTKGGSVTFKDNPAVGGMKSVCISLRFLQMFCEGHNLAVQEFLRLQSSNAINYSIIDGANELLAASVRSFRFAIDNKEMGLIPMLVSTIDFLIESMQGSCLSNQIDCATNTTWATYAQLLLSAKYVNEEGSEDDDIVECDGEEVSIRMVKCRCKTALYILMFSVLEENYEESITTTLLGNISSKAICQDIIDAMDPNNSARILESALNPSSEDKENASALDEIRECAQKGFLVLKMMEDRAPPEHIVHQRVEELKACATYNIVAPTCGEVEIVRNKSVYRVHFITPDFVIEVKKRMVFFKRCQTAFENIPRSNPDEKVSVMNKNIKMLVNELQHMRGILQDENIRILVEYGDFLEDKPFLSAFVTLTWMALFYGKADDPYGEYGAWAEAVAHLLCLCHFLIVCVWLASYWLIHAPILAVYPKRIPPKPISSDSPPEKDFGVELQPFEIPLPPMPVRDPGESAAEKKTRLIAYAWASRYCICYTLLSFVALCGGPGLHWLLTFWWVEYFWLPYGEVVRIAVINIRSIVGTLLIGWVGIAMIFIGFFMFYIWHEDLQEATKGKQCTTAYNCVIYGLSSGIKGNIPANWVLKWETGGIPIDPGKENGRQLQWLLGMFSFAVFRYSWAGMIKGCVCGTFGKLAKKAAAKQADTDGKCLVCSIDRFSLDKYGGMFKHSNIRHNPWNYLGFASAIKLKDQDELTGLEQYVAELLALTSASQSSVYFPVRNCTDRVLEILKDANAVRPLSTAEMAIQAIKVSDEANYALRKEIQDGRKGQVDRLSDLESSMELVVSALKTLAPTAFEDGLEI